MIIYHDYRNRGEGYSLLEVQDGDFLIITDSKSPLKEFFEGSVWQVKGERLVHTDSRKFFKIKELRFGLTFAKLPNTLDIKDYL